MESPKICDGVNTSKWRRHGSNPGRHVERTQQSWWVAEGEKTLTKERKDHECSSGGVVVGMVGWGHVGESLTLQAMCVCVCWPSKGKATHCMKTNSMTIGQHNQSEDDDVMDGRPQN